MLLVVYGFGIRALNVWRSDWFWLSILKSIV